MTPPDREALSHQIRTRLGSLVIDDSSGDRAGFAIYTLSDPRDIRQVRYVGQTRNPRRRILQHLGTARLWLPDERPWWVKSPRQRPLYDWIRELYADGRRLPVMVISDWLVDLRSARLAERALIYEHLSRRVALLNVETEVLARQIPMAL